MEVPTIVLTGEQLEKMRTYSGLVRMLEGDTPGRVELVKPTNLLSNQEWDTLTLLLEPAGWSGPLIVRSHGRSIVNPLHNVSKSSIKNMMDYLLIDDEATFRRLVGAEIKPSAPSSTVATNVRVYNYGNNDRATTSPFNNSNNNNNGQEPSKKDKYRTNVVINNSENSWNDYEEEIRAGPVRRKLNKTHRGGRVNRKATRRVKARRA
jgi:hypothetical protein